MAQPTYGTHRVKNPGLEDGVWITDGKNGFEIPESRYRDTSAGRFSLRGPRMTGILPRVNCMIGLKLRPPAGGAFLDRPGALLAEAFTLTPGPRKPTRTRPAMRAHSVGPGLTPSPRSMSTAMALPFSSSVRRGRTVI